MNISVDFSGLAEYQKRIKQAPEKASQAAELSMKTFVVKVKSDVQKSLNVNFPPVSEPGTPPHKRTGHLYQSVYNKINKLSSMVIQGVVGDNAEYAPMLEYGTSKMSPRPYIRPAVENNKNLFVNLFKIIFDKL